MWVSDVILKNSQTIVCTLILAWLYLFSLFILFFLICSKFYFTSNCSLPTFLSYHSLPPSPLNPPSNSSSVQKGASHPWVSRKHGKSNPSKTKYLLMFKAEQSKSVQEIGSQKPDKALDSTSSFCFWLPHCNKNILSSVTPYLQMDYNGS